MNLLRALGLLGVAYAALLLVSVLPALCPLHLPLPDVALLVALYAGLTCRHAGAAPGRDGGPAAMAAFALLLGYMADLLSGAPRGIHALSLVVLILLLRSAATQILVRGVGFVMAVAGLTALLFGVLTVGLRAWADPLAGWSGLRAVPGQAAVTAVCAPLLFAILRRVDARLWRDPHAQGLSMSRSRGAVTGRPWRRGRRGSSLTGLSGVGA